MATELTTHKRDVVVVVPESAARGCAVFQLLALLLSFTDELSFQTAAEERNNGSRKSKYTAQAKTRISCIDKVPANRGPLP